MTLEFDTCNLAQYINDNDYILYFQCHESRSLTKNRLIARELLKQKLDLLCNGKESAVGRAIAKIKKRKASYARKRRKREEAFAKGLQNMDGPSDSVEDDDEKPSVGK